MSKQVNAVVSGDESEIHDEPHIRVGKSTVDFIPTVHGGAFALYFCNRDFGRASIRSDY
jgi:hypothetical protein